ncbi:MAG: hypothetical protein ACQEV6_03185 [Pseudomonadota bacterium]
MTPKRWIMVGGAVACLKPMALVTIAGTLIPLVAHAAPRDLAFPGYSGYLNVPSATVLQHGQADVMYSDQALRTRQAQVIKEIGAQRSSGALPGVTTRISRVLRKAWSF